MTRTIESIVACHEDAAALRARGRPIWARTINIKAVLHRDDVADPIEALSRKATDIAALLRSSLPSSAFAGPDVHYNFVDAVEELELCTPGVLASLESEKPGSAADHIDGLLEMVYDYFDRQRIWAG